MRFNGLFFVLLLLSGVALATEKTPIRIGVQTTGTVAWELAVLLTLETDFDVLVNEIANPEAGKAALQAGEVDMIVSDWLWVARQRASGADYTFYPYSTTSGALVVPKDSPIHSIKDLLGKRLGIAGGELDKNWLLLQALGKQKNVDLSASVEKIMGAPALLSEKLRQNRLDAVLTYWHFAARLEAEAYRQIVDGKGILNALGINGNEPALGYMFKQSWVAAHKPAVKHFLTANLQAKKQLCVSDAAWKNVLPLTQTNDPATQANLRRHYCAGNIQHWGGHEQQAIARIYTLLRTLSDHQLTGSSENLPDGTFWSID
ncbi:MAG: ABC transporter substrate-binding protein [Methylovulum sp.]|uniref:ABC transporter substrate-binding protein n=1 Tax=Methylovulum sp. TaxID=1916980 RepID=UPI00260D13C4|nr:ABC transporter substrate-binding protein [Methylovulum sp.]MDD2724148.1 ABC transporter substrate-binding protein [Methylovulum sp.]MDD5123180.1 ABC transporter substrate-binding protein [Methylovulum sp.]